MRRFVSKDYGVRKTTSNIQVLAELGSLLFKTYIETEMFKYLQCLPVLEENTYLRKDKNEEIKIKKFRVDSQFEIHS